MLKLLPYSGDKGSDYDCLIASECPDCFIRVTGFRDVNEKYTDTTVFISAFTAHNNNDQTGYKWRLTRMWRIFRGRNDPSHEIMTKNVMDNLITALTECRAVIFKD